MDKRTGSRKEKEGGVEVLESSGLGSGDGEFMVHPNLERSARKFQLPDILLDDESSKYITNGLDEVGFYFKLSVKYSP